MQCQKQELMMTKRLSQSKHQLGPPNNIVCGGKVVAVVGALLSFLD